MKAILSNYKQSPRKVRLVANLIKGKTVKDAGTQLTYLVKRASSPIHKLLDSAVSNAVAQTGATTENLIVKNVTVDKGIVMKRSMPRAFGRASRINKRTSNVVLTLEQKEAKVKAKKK
jgi:large subunit ribosomal protein L22